MTNYKNSNLNVAIFFLKTQYFGVKKRAISIDFYNYTRYNKMDMNRHLFLIPILIWMVVVFFLSNEPADTSENTSMGVTEEIVNIFAGSNVQAEEKQQIIEKLDPIVRKMAHFVEYAVGGFFIVLYTNTYNLENKRKILYAICFGAMYACTDEFHQYFVPGRGMMITDVLLDTCGVATGVGIFELINNIIKRSKQREKDTKI